METLHYDALNRLDSSKIGSSEKIFTYDLAGNIQSKSGTGIYTYPAPGPTAVRPHAVSTVTPPGGVAGQFGYDDNGNLTSGSTFGTWTRFDMPIRLTKGSVWADFTYGPEHQRTSQHRSDGSWVYYAGAQEVDTAGGTTVKTYWPNGIGVEIDRGTSPTELSWTHVDRLGSPIALTNETGGIREKLEYDVWGKRRDTLDNESTPDTLDGKTDNRGFTGHEMLDSLDLVHMNGRVYSPLIGKFLSGDPIVQDPTNGQNYNRFSYVLNNPTNLTDPTGFSPLIGGCNWENFCQSTSFVEPGVNNGKSKGEGTKPAPTGAATTRSQAGESSAKISNSANARNGNTSSGSGGVDQFESGSVVIIMGRKATPLTEHSRSVIENNMVASGVSSLTVTSVYRRVQCIRT